MMPLATNPEESLVGRMRECVLSESLEVPMLRTERVHVSTGERHGSQDGWPNKKVAKTDKALTSQLRAVKALQYC